MDNFSIAANVVSTPLCIAARKGEREILCRLLEKGHYVNLSDNRGWRPLHEAIAHGHLDCVRLLLQHDECNENACTYDGMSTMYVACQYQNNIDLFNLLVEHGVSCNIGNTENITPLHVACKLYKFDLVKELIKHGAAINVQDFNSFTPLMEAIEQVMTEWNRRNEAPLEIVRFLLDNGANVSLTDLYGRTALFIAAYVKWNECIQLLLDFGSNVNVRTTDGGSALMVAAQFGDLTTVKLLLDHGAAADTICDKGTMPLHHALHNGFISVAEELMKQMNFKDIVGRKNRNLESFLILAIDSGSFESFKLVMNNKIYSDLDQTRLSSMESSTLLHDTCFRHYKYQTPLSFLLYQHIGETHTLPMLKHMLESEDFSPNASDEYFMPSLVALIAGAFSDIDKVHVNDVKQKCFLKLLEAGADIDYCSVKTCRGSLQIPDAVMAVIMPRSCSMQQSLLLPVLAHCFACDWDDLFDWLATYETCSASVLNVLIRLGIKSKQSLLNVWENIKQCQCHICKNNFPNIKKLVYERVMTLQSLCRFQVRCLLWKKTKKSNEAVKHLHQMCIPLPVKQYIMPVKLNYN